ncbi:hypothetical protein M5V91_22905 [Cytobacillus pseudoceanisediminis]|uniref:hypothetical protein n=1 Tax=Cytobacillus pseudoceanisediminis TaxID=3051614 RepID=UPI00218C2AAD|nr:hypothetical protein [Cytobacillus pseudoceanisediminis]UQX53554.1 hypothetical protein M5V91_22905 [Cytobacillus pseudoceanisediminis]
MADFRSSEIINKPVHEVFDYMIKMENVPELMPFVVNVEKQTEGEIGKGTRFIETRMVRGKKSVQILKLLILNKTEPIPPAAMQMD